MIKKGWKQKLGCKEEVCNEVRVVDEIKLVQIYMYVKVFESCFRGSKGC